MFKTKKCKLLSIILVIVLMLGLLASGCRKQGEDVSDGGSQQSDKNDSSEKKEDAKSDKKEDNKDNSKETVTLSYFWDMDAKASMSMKSYGEIAFFQEAEKATGVKIDWKHPPAGQGSEQFNLMLASQEMADMVYWNWRGVSGGPGKAIEDGLIVDLNDVLDYTPNFKRVLDENPDWHKDSILDNGALFVFPFIRGARELQVSSGLQIRKDWIDRLGLEVPTTVDEWHTVLKEFKTKDANGNGDPNDEIPFVSPGVGRLRDYWCFAWGVKTTFQLKDDKVVYGPMEPEYKEFLSTMAQWYAEGLIDPDFATTDGDSFDAKVTNSEAGSYFGMVSGNLGRFMQLVGDEDSEFQLVGAPYPKGPSGIAYGPAIVAVQANGTAISADSKHIERAAEFLDYAYGEEGHMAANFGIEGESYTMEDGAPRYTDIVMNNPDLPFANALIRYAMSISSGPFVQDVNYLWGGMLELPEQKEAVMSWLEADPSLHISNGISLTEEEGDKLSQIMSEINTYRDEMFLKFVMGEESIEKFDDYVKVIENMNIDEAIKIQQAVLDRYNAR